jgi:hypothetical protein
MVEFLSLGEFADVPYKFLQTRSNPFMQRTALLIHFIELKFSCRRKFQTVVASRIVLDTHLFFLLGIRIDLEPCVLVIKRILIVLRV